MFEELGLAPQLLRAVVREGYTTPTPIQTEAIPHVMAGRDLLGSAQTGTGKTAAFALPILHRLMQAEHSRQGRRRPVRVLILSPTRELASQIGDSFRAYGRQTALCHAVIFGGVGQQSQIRDLQRGADILIATPGRLLDLMGQGFVDLNSVETFVLDEADRMLDMGFLPDVRRVIARLPMQRQTVLFSATLPASIARLAAAILRDPVRVHIAPRQATTELIDETVWLVSRQHKAPLLIKLLSTQAATRAMVFTRTKRGADRVVRQLNHSGIRAEAIHGDKSQAARQRALANFKSSRPPVLVATDVAARGIDVDDVSHIFNYDLPHEPEMYVHRIGRTGRAGASGIAISFCDDEERDFLKAIERLIQRTLLVERDTSAPPSRAPHSAVQEPVVKRAHYRSPQGTGSRPKAGQQQGRRFRASNFGQRRGKTRRGAIAAEK